MFSPGNGFLIQPLVVSMPKALAKGQLPDKQSAVALLIWCIARSAALALFPAPVLASDFDQRYRSIVLDGKI